MPPLDGEQVMVIGAVPPVAVGEEKVTGSGSPLADATVDGAGHASVIAGGVDGPVGVFEHAAAALAHRTTIARRRL
jgi:hypothetical protein